ncbi:hypothetical protein [Streptomyces sp. NPDC086777]|uniref:hypothetical protein n=1 Tax=Streptomyces sp. NPDC086777 TaxID=3154866 RepID=UPI00344B77FB
MTVIGGRTRVDTSSERTGTTPGGPEGNERLTAATGAVLLVLFAVEGVTILFLGQLITLHFFIGLLLTGPVCLKIGSTGYRFYRYYTGSPEYRRKGPPVPLLRVLGPLVVATSVAVLGTGVALALLGPDTGPVPVLLLHKASFICWIAVMTVHVLAYLWRLPRLISADLRRRPARHGTVAPRRGARWSLLAVALGAGLVVALAGVHLVSAWTG